MMPMTRRRAKTANQMGMIIMVCSARIVSSRRSVSWAKWYMPIKEGLVQFRSKARVVSGRRVRTGVEISSILWPKRSVMMRRLITVKSVLPEFSTVNLVFISLVV